MPYLSRVWINPLRPKGREYLRNPQATHAAILSGFVSQPVGERVLWRLTVDTRMVQGALRPVELLVLSASPPSLEHIVEGAGYPGSPDGPAVTRDYRPLLDRVVDGAEFAFRVRVNPVVATVHPVAPSPAQQRRLEEPGRRRGVRLPHRTLGHQLDWFASRAERWGFAIPRLDDTGALDLVTVEREQVSFPKGPVGDRRLVRLSTVTLEGRLRVVDRDAMIRSLLDGIGPAKAYGCGLLTLAPLAHRVDPG